MGEFQEVDYSQWGPWKNHWGYITTIAQFTDEDIILKSITPCKRCIVRHFCNWEECQQMIELIEQDRRF